MMNKMTERLTALALAILMLFSCFSLAEEAQAAERTEADYVFTDYGHSYHLVSFLNGYNVLAFGNAHSKLHMMGAILVQGVYSGDASNSGFADGENLPPSFVKGELLAPNSVYNSRNHTNVAPLYVGSANTVTTWVDNGVTKYSVNGLTTGLNGTTPAYVSDEFFKFDEAYEVIKADQATMQARGKVVTPVNGVVTVKIGDNVVIESLAGVHEINFIGDPTEDVNTTVSVLDSGEVNVPREHFNGSQPSVREQNDAGTAVVFSFPNADVVKLPTQNWVGHVIAPDADVSQESGNFNGCIICENIYTGAEGHIYNYNTEETSWDTVFSLEKIWNDGHDADGIRPDYIEVQLLANGQPYGDVVRLTAAHDWYYVWPTLPEFDSSGARIVYSAREVSVPAGYTSEYVAESQTLINTHDYEEIDVTGTKTWAGESRFGSRMRPMYLTVYLYADGEEIDSQTITVTDAQTQSYAFTGLPKYKNGREIVYTVHEDTVPGYIGTSSGYDLTNTWGVESIEIHGAKTWNDANDADGLRPTSVSIELLADGVVIEEHIATAAHGWVYAFTNLPETNQNGKAITYTVREKDVPKGYTATVSGYDIINDHEQETIDLSGKKTWNDDNNNDGLRPAAITVILLADQAEVARKTVTAADGWAWEFNDMPKNFGGKAIHYTVAEEPVEGYTVQTSGMNLTNTHENETVDISGAKTWVDHDDNDGLRPASITITLLQDGKTYASRTVTEADGWAWAFTDLPKYTDGHEHVYTITEAAIEGYTAEVDGYDVTNTHENETIDVLGHKVWNDNDNNDGVRPSRLTVYLLADGVRTDKYRTTTEEKNWYWIFEDLPRYEDGREIVYTFEEEAVAGYTGPVTTRMTTLPVGYGDVGYELTNTHEDETVEISGKKTWSDENNQDGKRPASITIRLWKTVAGVHEEVASKTVTAADNWAWDFGEQPRYENGQEIIYTVTEDVVEDYSAVITGYDVENTYTPGKVNISGIKYWNDQNDQDGLRPEQITVRLHKTVGGVTTEVDAKVVTAADNWAGHFIDLPEYENGEKIVYTITEDPVPGYESVVDQFDLINTHIPETVEISGAKTWNDNNDQDGLRPERITIRLWKTVGGTTTEVKNAAITAAGSWKWHFVNLPKYEDGELITYTITEDAVAGYTTEIRGADAINTHETEETTVSGSKTWNDADDQDGKRPASITIRLWNGTTEVASKTVTAADGWKWAFTDLPRYADGQEIVYTITEDVVEDYTTEIRGYDVTNSYTPETTEVSGYKVWEDDSNRDGRRPASITIHLWADGSRIASKTVTAANGWMWRFTDLPKYADGKLITYTVTEDAVAGYTTVVSGYNVTNTYETETTSVSGSKSWNDNNNQDGMRPAAITIHLLADGTEVAQKKVTAANGWHWSFTDLPKYADGELITYTIAEDVVAGYTTMIVGYDVINSRTTETTEVSGMKHWVGDEDADARPESITINLLANGQKVDSQTVTRANGWQWRFTDLPVYQNGQKIAYTVTEDDVYGYISRVEGFDVYNTYGLTSFAVSKRWRGVSGGAIDLVLYANGEMLDPQPRLIRDGDVYYWEDLPLYDENGEVIMYYAAEKPMDGYATIYENVGIYAQQKTRVHNGGTIINCELTDVKIRKVWSGVEKDETVPAIKLVLYCNGTAMDVSMPAPDADGWYCYADLPAVVDGERAVYTVREEPVDGYMTTYTDRTGKTADEATDGGTITNQKIPSTGDSTPLLLWTVLLMVSAAALTLMLRRRRHA